MNYKKGFTLVELLAVIVILAIILVIAVPKILTVINDTSTESLKSSAKMIISSAEREYATRTALGQSTTGMTCTDVTSLSSTDYILVAGVQNCNVSFDPNGNATLFIWGASGGKFAGKCVIGGTRDSVSVSTSCDSAE